MEPLEKLHPALSQRDRSKRELAAGGLVTSCRANDLNRPLVSINVIHLRADGVRPARPTMHCRGQKSP